MNKNTFNQYDRRYYYFSRTSREAFGWGNEWNIEWNEGKTGEEDKVSLLCIGLVVAVCVMFGV